MVYLEWSNVDFLNSGPESIFSAPCGFTLCRRAVGPSEKSYQYFIWLPLSSGYCLCRVFVKWDCSPPEFLQKDAPSRVSKLQTRVVTQRQSNQPSCDMYKQGSDIEHSKHISFIKIHYSRNIRIYDLS